MNHSAQNSVMGSDSLLIQPELCEVCDGKDEEDLYIVFNALYRVIVGDVFYQGSDNTEKELALNSMSIPLAQQKQKDFKTSQEKLQLFRKKLSSQALIDLVALPRFDLLLREIFKSKYNRVQDTSCKHQELAMNFIRNFNLKNDEFFENSDANKRRLIENTEKLDILYNKIKQLKTEIETYHSEIDGLSEKIVKKLLPHNSHFISKKLNVCDDNDNDSDDQGSDFQETFVEKKPIRNNSDSLINASVSTGLSSESSSNSDKSDEEKLERKHKKSKTATFKSKLPKKATDVLKNWFLNNIQNPYPSHEAKELLSKMTGLTRKQIQNWFTNSRKRFLEPLKKKIEGQKNGKEGSLTLDQANEIFTSETQSPIDPSDLSITQEPIMITQTIVPTQSKTKPAISFASSNLQALNENIIKPVTALQKTSPQISSPAQSMMYPQANNFVVVPYLVPQPVYPYRPSYPNLLSMSSPQIIPLQQNNYPSNFPLVDTALPNQFGFTMPTNFMDMGAMMKQQMPATFNAMNASLYNSINHQVVNNLQRSTSSLYHPRPELPELNRLGPKFLHKDHGLRVNLG